MKETRNKALQYMSFNEKHRVSDNVISWRSGSWERFERIPRPVECDFITGKYLFFSPYREDLVNIAIDEIENGGFFSASINIQRSGRDFVLFLHDIDDSRKNELANEYKNHPSLDYRYWKSYIDTCDGFFSEQFLQTISEEKIERITKPNPENRKLFLERERSIKLMETDDREIERWDDPSWKKVPAVDKNGLPKWCPKCNNVLYRKGNDIFCESCKVATDKYNIDLTSEIISSNRLLENNFPTKRENKIQSEKHEDFLVLPKTDAFQKETIPSKIENDIVKSSPICEKTIMDCLPENDFMEIARIIESLKVKNVTDSRFLNVILKVMVNKGKIQIECRNGKPFYRRLR